MKFVEPQVEILHVSENAAQLIEMAGRTCYKSEDAITSGSAEKFVARIARSGHHSVIEHAHMTVRFITDRGVSHELVRHRIASFSQESTRFCNYSGSKFGGELSFILPLRMRRASCDGNADSESLFVDTCFGIERIYINLIESGWKPEDARAILPNCLKTEIVMTANLREWAHVINLRSTPEAHPDIREIMGLLVDEMKDRGDMEFFLRDMVRN